MPQPVHFICDRGTMEHYFRFECVDGSEGLQESYALRYQVYCLERGFLPAADYPNASESDDCDDRSLHFGAFYKDGGLAGTARLIQGTLAELPVARRCVIDPSALPPGSKSMPVLEISRLAVSRAFRRRATDGALPDQFEDRTPPPAPAAHRRRGCPELVLGLYKIMYHETKRRGVDWWFAAMEQTLVRLLQRCHFSFHAIGPEVDYYGPVAPYIARISDLEAEVYAHRPDLLREFADGLERELWPLQLS